jgi:hypothetical protein
MEKGMLNANFGEMDVLAQRQFQGSYRSLGAFFKPVSDAPFDTDRGNTIPSFLKFRGRLNEVLDRVTAACT